MSIERDWPSANVSPDPLAAQLAISLGYIHYSFLGVTLVAIAFVIPSFLMVCQSAGGRISEFRWDLLDAGRVLQGGIRNVGIIAWKQLSAHPERHRLRCSALGHLRFDGAITAITDRAHHPLPVAGLAVWIARHPRLRLRRGHWSRFFLLPIALQAAGSNAGPFGR